VSLAYDTAYGVFCSPKCAEPDTDDLITESEVTDDNYPDGFTCPTCDKVVIK
jgi:hypothetical protein